MQFEVYMDAEGYLGSLKKMAKQLPFAESVALNKTANIVRDALRNTIKQTFDRPTKRTLNAVWVDYSSKEQDERHVLISLNDKATGKNTVTAAQYLAPQIEGGKRNQKRGEKAVMNYTAFQGLGGKGTKFLTPSKFAPIDDGHGNIPGSAWTRILSDIKGLSTEVSIGTKTRTGKKPKAGGYFISRTKPMIMQRVGDAAIPILIGVKSTNYDKKLPWYETIDKVWNANIDEQVQKALGDAIASAF